MHRKTTKILMGMAALALPIGTMAVLGGQPAFAKKPPPNPVHCNVAATVNISPPLSVAGQPAAKGTSGVASVAVTYSGCTTTSGASVGPFNGHLNVYFKASKPTKDQAALNAGDNKKDYYVGLCGEFASSSTIKDLKKAVKNMPFAGGELKGAKPSEGTIGAEVGFIINGTVKNGTYPTASHAASLKAGLTNDANNSNLISGCKAGPVNHIDIDSSNSSATL
ncbi:MAG TPA: hypothetical protein VLZ77_15680 [Acidimicrobiales bacterium]|nr:hypothetical protein [Acidimicrobiales bacterium]